MACQSFPVKQSASPRCGPDGLMWRKGKFSNNYPEFLKQEPFEFARNSSRFQFVHMARVDAGNGLPAELLESNFSHWRRIYRVEGRNALAGATDRHETRSSRSTHPMTAAGVTEVLGRC